MNRLNAPPSRRCAYLRNQSASRVVLYLLVILTAGCGRVSPKTPEGVYVVGPVFAEDTPKVSHRFTVTNTTGKTVQVTGESHSCVCTKVEFERRSLQPGESMPLTMEVAVPRQKVELDLGCTLHCDDPDHPRWTYHVLLNAYPKAEIEPSRIDLTHSLPPSDDAKTASAYLTCYNLPGSEIPQIQNLVAPSHFEVDFGRSPEVTILNDGVRRLRFPISFREKNHSSSSGTYAEPLNFSVTGIPLSAMVLWKTSGPLSVTPSSISFGLLDAKSDAKTLLITVKSTDGRPFRIANLHSGESATQFITEPSESSSKSQHVLALAFDPSRSSGRRVLAGIVTIQTDLDGASVCSVHWSAFIRSKTSAPSN